MDTGISGRTAIVTGASRGLGRACAEALAAEGARLLLFSRSAEPLEQCAADLCAKGADATAVAGDMSSAADVARLVTAAGGAPDILVLNTGRPPLQLQEVLNETDEERWAHAHETQLKAAVRVLSAIAPLMVERRHGRIVAITSATVKQPMPRHGLSTIYRAGLTAYLKHLANEIVVSGVTVNAVCPASIGTEGFLASFDRATRAKQVPMQRLGTPEELAAAVVFFASEKAGFITGASLQVDGGMTAAFV